MSNDDWDDHIEFDTMTWILFAACVVSIVLMACVYAFGFAPDVTISTPLVD